MKFNKKKVFIGLIAIISLSQFIRIDKTPPASDPTADFIAINMPDKEVADIIRNACYDCHSHQTEYPWYADIAPVSWWLKGHVNGARQHLNFSTWSAYPIDKQKHKLEECIETIEKGEMPMKSFTWTHPEARLTDEQKSRLVGFFKSQFRSL